MISETVHEVAEVLRGIEGIAGGAGQVHEFIPYTASEREFQEAFAAGGAIHCWIVTREATASADIAAGGAIRDQHKLAVYGYRAVSAGSDSERQLQELAELVRDTFHALRSGGQLRRLPNSAGVLRAPVAVESFVQVYFGAALCHRVKLALTVEDRYIGG